MPAIADCYKEKLSQTPAWTGAAVVEFEISSTGKISSVSAEGAKVEAECVERAIQRMTLPTSKERTATTARYSFELGPTEPDND